jgi:hypothetical protein
VNDLKISNNESDEKWMKDGYGWLSDLALRDGL